MSKTVMIPLYKTYTEKMIPFRGSLYQSSAEWIAYLYYTQINPDGDNVEINIKGDFHKTFPNPKHLSVFFVHDGVQSGIYHISVDDEFGYAYIQPLPNTRAKKKRKTKKAKKSKKKQKQKKQKNKQSKKK